MRGQLSAVMMAKSTAFSGLFQPEGGKRLLNGGAGTHGAQADIDAEALIQLQKGVCRWGGR